MPKSKKTTANIHPAQTPGGYVVTGIIMWIIGYVLLSLAINSGSMFQWAGFLVALIWGGVRIAQGIRMKLSQNK